MFVILRYQGRNDEEGNLAAKICWTLIFFLLFCGLGFFVFEVVKKYRFEPIITEHTRQIYQREIPQAAVTVCSSLFARDEKANLREFLKNPGKKLSAEEQDYLAANVQACAPQLSSKVAESCPLANISNLITILKTRNLTPNETFDICAVGLPETDCNKIFNHVLTDYGFCFSFNLEGFHTLFNSDVISDDFKCYERKNISKSFYVETKKYFQIINDSDHQVDWNLEKGYFTKSSQTVPVRATPNDKFAFAIDLYDSDFINYCPESGKFYYMFFHMPNEILTPFHAPEYISFNRFIYMESKLHTTDESLRFYSPQKRGCYFEGERNLKFFKSYTKAHCDFECMANYTLDVCGCVKFSMPRDNFTPICGLNKTHCYVKATKEWSRATTTCDCYQSCTYIQYSIKRDKVTDKTGT